MDMQENRFVMRPAESDDPFLLAFDIGEEVEIKGYIFRIEHIDADKEIHVNREPRPTLLVLSPVRPRKDVLELAKLAAVK